MRREPPREATQRLDRRQVVLAGVAAVPFVWPAARAEQAPPRSAQGAPLELVLNGHSKVIHCLAPEVFGRTPSIKEENRLPLQDAVGALRAALQGGEERLDQGRIGPLVENVVLRLVVLDGGSPEPRSMATAVELLVAALGFPEAFDRTRLLHLLARLAALRDPAEQAFGVVAAAAASIPDGQLARAPDWLRSGAAFARWHARVTQDPERRRYLSRWRARAQRPW